MVMALLHDCAELVRDSMAPDDIEGLPYIGLEHISVGGLRLMGHGFARDVSSVKTRFKEGDILFGKLRPYFRKVVKAPFNGICSTDIWVVRAKEGMDQEFLRYCMSSKRFIDFATAGSEGTRMPRAKWDFVSGFGIRCPDLSEQRAIAHILGTLDDKIELNCCMNEALEAMGRALFKSWFVDFEPVRVKMEGRDTGLPADVADCFPDEFDDCGTPLGWGTKPLSDIATFLNGLALQKFPAEDESDSLPVIKIAELRSGVTSKSGRASRDVPQNYVINNGDFLFSWSGSLIAKFWTEGEGALNQHLFKVTSNQYPQWFFSEWVHHHLPDFQTIAAAKATTMGHIQRGHLKEAMVNCPPHSTITTLGRLIAPLTERIILGDIENQTLAKVRDLLLPKLVSGQIRLCDAQRGGRVRGVKTEARQLRDRAANSRMVSINHFNRPWGSGPPIR